VEGSEVETWQIVVPPLPGPGLYQSPSTVSPAPLPPVPAAKGRTLPRPPRPTRPPSHRKRSGGTKLPPPPKGRGISEPESEGVEQKIAAARELLQVLDSHKKNLEDQLGSISPEEREEVMRKLGNLESQRGELQDQLNILNHSPDSISKTSSSKGEKPLSSSPGGTERTENVGNTLEGTKDLLSTLNELRSFIGKK